MCGIAGLRVTLGAPPIAFDELLAMAAVQRHRGPDGIGFYRDAEVGLAHARLSLVDLAGGAQPLANEDHTLWLVANGEVFTHEALRAELVQRGHRCRTRSDSEVVLHAYEEWGPAAWSRLNGQFAFALWDTRRRELHLVRDRFGILPLHYAELPGGGIAFASEAKALFAGGRVRGELDLASLHQVFTLWAAPGPATVFRGVQVVPPGGSVVVDAGGHIRRTIWWRPDFGPRSPIRSLDEAAERLGERLREAVRLRARADVPVGAYLSGGIDSSVVTALAAAEGARLATFAVGFEEAALDERPMQRRVAELLGTRHHEVVCTGREVRARLPEVVWHCETPLLRTGPVPMFMLAELAHRHGIKAVLTGEGADEWLGGYSIFLEDKVRRFWARQPASTARPALLGRVHDFVATAEQRESPMWRAFYGLDRSRDDDPCRAHAVRWQNNHWTTRVLQPLASADEDGDWLGAARRELLAPGFATWTDLARAQAVEIVSFMTPYLLASQGDRVALAHGVEARYPFLDPDVVDFCLRLPDARKVRGLRTKVALRTLAKDLLPPEIAERKKQPYRAPVTTALFAPGPADYVDELLAPDALAANPLLDGRAAGMLVAKARRAAGRVAEREAMAVCGVLTTQLLCDHLRRLPAVVATRVAAAPQHPDVLAGDLTSATPTPSRP